MELIERVDLKAVKWILSQLSTDFVAQNKTKVEECTYSYIKKVLERYSKNKGVVKCSYKKTDKHKLLRDYGSGIQSLPSTFRGLLCSQMFDIDIVNCQPMIILNICKLYNIRCNQLEVYCNERDELIRTEQASKQAVIKCINSNKRWRNLTPFMEMFDIEMKQIQQELIKIDDFKIQKDMAEEKHKKDNIEGTFMSHIFTTYESKILRLCIDLMKIKNVEIGALMFDGFMTYSIYDDILIDLKNYIHQQIQFTVQFIIKPHNQLLTIPTDWKPDDPELLYAQLKEKYEKDYKLSFIQEHVLYSFKIGNKLCFYNPSEIKHQFDTEFIGDNNFFTLWNADPSKQVYNSIGVYPHDRECPNDVLNIWTGYEIEKYIGEVINIDDILEHINTLVHHDEVIYNFVLDWIANMFQFPSNQSILLAFTGAEGSGRSAICEFLFKIIGDKSIEISDMNEMFGSFNDQLSCKVFLNINEVSRHDMMKYTERLKTIITSPTINIKTKQKSTRSESNLLHIMLTTNNDNVLDIKENSRRYFLYETNDILRGNTDYFNHLYSRINNKKVQYSFYKMMMERRVKSTITLKDIPITKIMKECMELNRNPVEDYAIQFIGERSAENNYQDFKHYMMKQGYKHEMTRKSFEAKFNKYIEKHNIEKIPVDKVVDGERVRTIYKHKIMITM